MAKKMRSVKNQLVREVYSDITYGDWMKNDHNFKHGTGHGNTGQKKLAPESPRANPDNLPEEESVYFVKDIDREVQDRVRKLLELSKQILTEQQYHVFVLMAVKEPHMTVRETAKVLSISSSRVGQLWTAARKKLEKAYEQRTA